VVSLERKIERRCIFGTGFLRSNNAGYRYFETVQIHWCKLSMAFTTQYLTTAHKVNNRLRAKLNFYSPKEIFFLNLQNKKVAFRC
jgi:hypothetical protein